MSGIRKTAKLLSKPKKPDQATGSAVTASNAISPPTASHDNWRGEARDTAIMGLGVLKNVSEATGVLAPLKAVCGLIIDGIETARSIQKNKEAWNELAEELNRQYESVQVFLRQIDDKKKMDHNLSSILTNYSTTLEVILNRARQAKEYSQASLSRRIGKARIDAEQVQELKDSVDRAYKHFMEAMTMLLHQNLNEVKQQLSELRLPITESGMIEASDPFFTLVYGADLEICQEGTRQPLFQQIKDWAQGDITSKQVFWLHDMAGMGKTTASTTLARQWKQDCKLAGRFFFTPNSKTASGISEFCLTIARDMFILLEPLRVTLGAAILDTPSSHFSFQERFERLIIMPLIEYDKPTFILIDALDNCEYEGRQKLLETLITLLPKVPKVKVFLTSRPVPDIQKKLDLPELVEDSDMGLQGMNEGDIKAYVGTQLSDFDPEEREAIISQADGLFIWASTACHLVKNSRRPKQLLKRIDVKTADSLDMLYLEVMKQASGDPEERDMLMDVLRIIMTAFEPVSIITIQELLPQVDAVYTFVHDLGSVLRSQALDQPIQIIHPTFREFLSNLDRSKNYHIDPVLSHSLMTLSCLNTLHRSLKFDILNQMDRGKCIPRNEDISDFKNIIDSIITPAMSYGSSHWPYHATVALSMDEVITAIDTFLDENALNWIELEGWRSGVGRCLMALSGLRIAVQHTERSSTNSLMYDKLVQISDFIQKNQALIRTATLHVYCSALAFTGITGEMIDTCKGRYISSLPNIKNLPDSRQEAFISLSGHEPFATAAVFSPDDSRLATSGGTSVHLWDVLSGADIIDPLPEVNSRISSIAFSYDGGLLLLGRSDGSLILLNGKTGEMLDCYPNAHKTRINKVLFSHNSLSAVSISKDGTFCRWSASSGQLTALWGTLSVQISASDIISTSDMIPIDMFSTSDIYLLPDEKGLISICDGRAVFYWSWETFQVRTIQLENITGFVCQMVLSPSGSYLLTQNERTQLIIWDILKLDAGSIVYRQTLAKPSRDPLSSRGIFTFSPSEVFIASNIERVRLWRKNSNGYQEVQLSESLSTPNYYRLGPLSFSSDSTQLATVLDIKAIILETITGQVIYSVALGPPFYYHSLIATISHNLRLVALGSHNNNVSLHDISTPSNPPVLTGIHISVYRFDISPNGELIVTAHSDGSLCIWSTSTGGMVSSSRSEDDKFPASIEFSPDGRLVVLIFPEEGDIKIWDIDGSEVRGTLTSSPSIQGRAQNFTFSPDGSLIAIACHSPSEVLVWSTMALTSGAEPIYGFKRHDDKSTTLSVSSNNQLIAVGGNKAVQLWNMNTGTSQGISLSYAGILQIAFSPDADRMGLLCFPQIIRLWDISGTPRQIFEVILGDDRPLAPLFIPSGGDYIGCGPSVWRFKDNEVQLMTDLPDNVKASIAGLRSKLSYGRGWVHSIDPPGRLLPIPEYIDVTRLGTEHPCFQWRAHGNIIVLVISEVDAPLIIDCSPMLQ